MHRSTAGFVWTAAMVLTRPSIVKSEELNGGDGDLVKPTLMAASVYAPSSSPPAMSLSAPPPPPFLPAQWVELQRQALIFKYFAAGVPVPAALVAPSSPTANVSAAYYAFFGKKVDLEPWRCRRTDGKKWRCSKEAMLPDSKYCERHMHRNRSRKPVESKNSSLSHQSTGMDVMALKTADASANWRGMKSNEAISPSSMTAEGKTHCLFLSGASSSQQHHSNSAYYDKYHQDAKFEGNELSFLTDAWQHRSPCGSGNCSDVLQQPSPSYMTPYPSLYPLLMARSPSVFDSAYACHSHELPQDFELGMVTRAQREQNSLWGGGGDSGIDGRFKPEEQLLRPFLEEWPGARGQSNSEEPEDRESSGLTLF